MDIPLAKAPALMDFGFGSFIHLDLRYYSYIEVSLMVSTILGFVFITRLIKQTKANKRQILAFQFFSVTTLISFVLLFLRDLYLWPIPIVLGAAVLIVNSWLLSTTMLRIRYTVNRKRFLNIFNSVALLSLLVFYKDEDALLVASAYMTVHYGLLTHTLIPQYRSTKNVGYLFMIFANAQVALLGPVSVYEILITNHAYFALAITAGTLMVGYVLNCMGFLTIFLINNQRKLNEMALLDPLTQVYNRRGLEKVLRRSFSTDDRRNISVLLIDIDHFKKINDTHGHNAGDEVLKGFAELILDNIRDTDVLARMGGEEFAVLLMNINYAQARLKAERLRQEIENKTFHIVLDRSKNETYSDNIIVTASIGVADGTTNDDFEALLNLADKRLYEAKENGRNQVVSRTQVNDKPRLKVV